MSGGHVRYTAMQLGFAHGPSPSKVLVEREGPLLLANEQRCPEGIVPGGVADRERMNIAAGINLANELQDIFQRINRINRINRIARDLSPEVAAALEAEAKRVF